MTAIINLSTLKKRKSLGQVFEDRKKSFVWSKQSIAEAIKELGGLGLPAGNIDSDIRYFKDKAQVLEFQIAKLLEIEKTLSPTSDIIALKNESLLVKRKRLLEYYDKIIRLMQAKIMERHCK